jgi:hypothetical protein
MTTTIASQALRNNLAHAQDIITCDWEIIVKLTEYLDSRFASLA